MINASFDLRSVSEEEKPDVIDGRIDHFAQQGFNGEAIEYIRRTFHATLVRPEDLDGKILALKERGFQDPVKMIISSPQILGYAIENIDGKIRALRERGFQDPVKMITAMPRILGLAIENIDGKIRALKERGFQDPVKMISSFPAILSLAIENIDGKIRALRERGFQDPVKMITAMPPILGYAIESIDGKLRLIEQLAEHFGVEVSANGIIECELGILSTKTDKLWTLARVLAEHGYFPTRGEIHAILFSKLEHVVIAHSHAAHGSFHDVLQGVKKRRKAGETKDELREEIAALLESQPGSKVLRRYVKGYPMA